MAGGKRLTERRHGRYAWKTGITARSYPDAALWFTTFFLMTDRRPTLSFALAAWLLLASCVDGDPAGVGVVRPVQLNVVPAFAGAGTATARSFDRARVTARRSGDGMVLGRAEQALDPNAAEWVVTVEVSLASAVTAHLEVELVASESVEWSGRTGAFTVTPAGDPTTIRRIDLFRGPLANLTVTGLEARGPSRLLRGQSGRVEVALVGGGDGARAFFESSDPSVVSVDGTGKIEGIVEGGAHVVVRAGPLADTLHVSVREVVLPEPDHIARAVGPGLDFTTDVTAILGDADGAAAVATALADLSSALSGRDGAGAVRALDAAISAWSTYGVASGTRALDAPVLGLIEIALIHAADALGVPFG